MSRWTSILLWGTAVFAVVGVILWFVPDHRPIQMLDYYLGFCAFVLFNLLESSITSWREESRGTAKKVEEICRRLDKIDELKEKCSTLDWKLDAFKTEFDEFTASVGDDLKEGLRQLDWIEEEMRNKESR